MIKPIIPRLFSYIDDSPLSSLGVILLRIYWRIARISLVRLLLWGTTSRNKCHEYWANPTDKGNKPLEYLNRVSSSNFMLGFISKYAGKEDKILEIGCSVGRSLWILYETGYENLSGIEINPEAVEILKSQFANTTPNIEVYDDAVENIIKDIPDNKYDIVFTMAVLEHIHEDSTWVFGEMARVTRKVLITLEDEMSVSWRAFPRNYQKVFEAVGMRQIDFNNCSSLRDLRASFNLRVFAK